MQTCPQLIGLGRDRGGQVMLLTNILVQVVKLHPHVIEPLYQFEVTRPYRPIGRRSALLIMLVMRVMPEKFVPFELPIPAQQRDEAHSIHAFPGRLFQTRHFQECRIQIHADHRPHTDAPGLGHTRPMHDQRHAGSSLVTRSFTVAQRIIGSGGNTAPVVRCKHHYRPLCQFKFIQLAPDAPHAIIHALNHGSIHGVHLFLARAPLRAVFLDQRFFSLDRRMHRKQREVQKKWFVPIRLDEPRGFFPHAIRKVFPLGPLRQRRDLVRREITRRRWRRTPCQVHIEPVLLRVIFLAAKMPFP